MGLFTSTFAQPMSRIKWQITEDMLIGRIAYERINDSDGRGVGAPCSGSQWRSASRATSTSRTPTTPPRGNDSTSSMRTASTAPVRRAYFRVDWSRNLNVGSYDFDTLSLLGVYGGVTYSPMAYDVLIPTTPTPPSSPAKTKATST